MEDFLAVWWVLWFGMIGSQTGRSPPVSLLPDPQNPERLVWENRTHRSTQAGANFKAWRMGMQQHGLILTYQGDDLYVKFTEFSLCLNEIDSLIRSTFFSLEKISATLECYWYSLNSGEKIMILPSLMVTNLLKSLRSTSSWKMGYHHLEYHVNHHQSWSIDEL